MAQVHTPITPKLVEGLYVEAMVLADEARGYFDRDAADDRGGLDPVTRVAFSCESLKVTTRLMHVVSWLLVRKAATAGEIDEAAATALERRLGRAPETDEGSRVGSLPPKAQAVIAASCDLYERVRRLDGQLGGDAGGRESPARALLDRLQASM